MQPQTTRSFLLISLVLAPALAPIAAAGPADDALAFGQREQTTLQNATANATRNGFSTYFGALADGQRLGEQAIDSSFAAYGDALNASRSTLVATTQGAFAGGQNGSAGVQNVTRDGGDLAFRSLDSALKVLDDSTRDAFNASNAAVTGTSDNLADAGDATGRALLSNYDGAVTALNLTRGLTDSVVAGGLAALQGADDATRAYGDGFFNTERAALANGSARANSSVADAIATTQAGLDMTHGLLGAMGTNAFTSYQQALKDSANVTQNATESALHGYFSTLNTTNDATGATGEAAFSAYFASLAGTYTVVQQAGRAGFETYFNATSASDAAARTAGDAAFGSAFVLTGATFGMVGPETQIAYSALAPCDPATGGGFRVLGSGDCIGKGIVSYSGPIRGLSSPVGSDGSTSSGGFRPYDRAPTSCDSGQYGFASIRLDQSGNEYLADETCISLAPSVATGLGLTDTFEGIPGDGNSVRIDYHKPTATLIVTDDYQDFVGLVLVIDGVETVYEAQHAVPKQLQFDISGITVGLLGEKGIDRELTTTYSGAGYNGWVEVGIQPDVSNLHDYDLVHLGRFFSPTGEWVGSTAPEDFSVDVDISPRAQEDATVTLSWNRQDSASTPIAVMVTKSDASSTTFVDSLPSTADFQIGFKDASEGGNTVSSTVQGHLSIGSGRIHRVWLPAGELDVQLADIPTLNSFQYQDVRVDGGRSPCDQDVWDQVASTRDPTGERQICVQASTYQTGGEVLVDGGAIDLHDLPSGKLHATLGPLGAIAYAEDENTAFPAELHATLQVAGDPRFTAIANLDIASVKTLYILPGETLASGAGASSCGSTGTNDPTTGRAETVLDATFSDEGSVAIDLVAARGKHNELQLSGVTAMRTTTKNELDLSFAATGGSIARFEFDLSNGCSSDSHISATASGLTGLTIWHGDGNSGDSSQMMLTRIGGIAYAAIDIHVDDYADDHGYDCGHRVLSAHLSNEPEGTWALTSDLDFPGEWCGSPEHHGRISGTEQYVQTFLGSRFVATYRLVRG